MKTKVGSFRKKSAKLSKLLARWTGKNEEIQMTKNQYSKRLLPIL